MLARPAQVICDRNETRRFLNQSMRQYFGLSGRPVKGDKLICLKNNWNEASTDLSLLINGCLAS